MIFVGFGCDEQLLLPTALTDTVADAGQARDDLPPRGLRPALRREGPGAGGHVAGAHRAPHDSRWDLGCVFQRSQRPSCGQETIMTTHIHFTLLLVFPPVFGMRWMTMVL